MKDGVSIIRKVDDIGRVLIPKDICQRFGWLPRTSLEILVGDECIDGTSIMPRGGCDKGVEGFGGV